MKLKKEKIVIGCLSLLFLCFIVLIFVGIHQKKQSAVITNIQEDVTEEETEKEEPKKSLKEDKAINSEENFESEKEVEPDGPNADRVTIEYENTDTDEVRLIQEHEEALKKIISDACVGNGTRTEGEEYPDLQIKIKNVEDQGTYLLFQYELKGHTGEIIYYKNEEKFVFHREGEVIGNTNYYIVVPESE